MTTAIKAEPGLGDDGLWSYHAGPGGELADCNESQPEGNNENCGRKRKLEDHFDGPAATCPPNLPTLADVNVVAPLDPHGDAPDTKRRAVEVIPNNRSDRDTSRCPHNDPVVKEEDVDDGFFVSQPRTPCLIPSTGTIASPSSLTSPSIFRRDTSESTSTESTPATPRPSPAPEPAHWQLTGDVPSCTCPIDLHCGVKEDHLIDCRPLVPEGENWCQSKPGLIPEHLPCNNAGETFATAEELTKMVQLCNEIMTEQFATAPASRRNAVIHRLQALTALLNRSSLHFGDLELSQVLPRLQDFLKPANEETPDARRILRSLREDLLMLVRRWEVGDLCALPNRGLLRRHNRHQDNNGDDDNSNNDNSSNGTSTGPSSWRVDPSWPWKRSAAVFGHGHCVNGQTWPNRLAMLRDGAHGMWTAGIHGHKHKGAYAIVMGLHLPKYIKYADVDFGETIYYIGTALKRASGDKQPTNVMDNPDDDDDDEEDNADRQPTDATKALIKSRSTQLPVRVFRSSKASKLVPGRPKQGYRYDGLYRVIDYECLKVVRQIYRFKMKRLTNDEAREWGGQGPLRGWEQRMASRRWGRRKC